MTSKPPPPKPLPSNWDLEDEGAGATREVEPDELFLRAGLVPGGRLAPARGGSVDPLRAPAEPAGPDLGDELDVLTPWAASAPNAVGATPATTIEALRPAAIGAAQAAKPDERDDAPGTGALGELDFSDLLPSTAPRRRAATHPPRSAVDELDELLSDEAQRVVRDETATLPRGRRAEVQALDAEISVSFEEAPLPAFDDLSAPTALELDLSDINPATLGLDDLTATELPKGAVPVLKGSREEEEEVERGPDTAVEAGARADVEVDAEGEPMRKRLERLRARFEVGDFGGALVIAEGILDETPRFLAARCYADACRALLQQMYQAKIGERAGVLRVIMPPDQLKALSLDHRTGFLLSCIDGRSTVEDVLDVSGMQALDALRMLYDLIVQGVIEAEPPPSGRA